MAKLTGYRVLLVEDEALIALDVAEALAIEGALVAGPANNVTDAKRLLAETIHCAILDVNLGSESVAPLVRKLEASRIPIVFVTGYDEHDIPVLWRRWPVLQKPMVTVDLVDAVARMCARSNSG
jgi:DNA-binding response OmpR family regulator